MRTPTEEREKKDLRGVRIVRWGAMQVEETHGRE